MHRQHVQRSIKRLIQLGIILEGVKIGISRSYRLNPSFGGKAQLRATGGSARALEGYQDKGAHGAALATLATCAHLSPDNQARLHNAISARFHCARIARGSRPLNPPKPLNECLRHTVLYCATPKGLANTVGAAHTCVRHVAGAGENLLHPYHRALGRLQPVKAKLQAVASQALTGFQLHPLRSFCYSRRWRGVKGGEAVHFTLDALEPTQHFATGSGGWVLTACPRGAASEVGVWGKAPRC